MKNKINFKYALLAFMLSIFSFYSCESQPTTPKGETPQAVKDTFKKMYPGENDPDWHLDKNDNYEAHFKMDGVKYNADFRPDGQWVETETRIKEKDLPEAIQDVLKEEYDDYKIVEIEKVIHHAKGIFFDVELKDKGEKIDVEFKENGSKLN